MLYSLLKVNRSVRGTYHIHLQGQRVSHAKNHHEAGSKHTLQRLRYAGLLHGLFFDPEDGIILQKRELFITTTVRTSNAMK
jgi:hypothetical protein